MHIRPASAGDVPLMHRIRLDVRENRLTPGSAIDEPSYLPFLGTTVIAEAEGLVVGFAALDVPRSSVWALFVGPSAQGCGNGRALHDALLDLAAAHGLERLSLTTAPGTRAERFYREAGWQPAGRADTGELRFERAVAASS
jgi:GNAT superfamily N-acetyltransferase